MKQVFVGKTVDEAKQLAVIEFGIDVSRITFSVIEEPKKTLFGKSKGDAKVEASYEPTKLELAVNYLRNILEKMGISDFDFKISETENGASINIVGDSCDAIIGKRGEALDSLQYLTSLVSNKGDKDFFRISLDTCNYREKRKSQLESLAAKIAKNVVKSGRSTALEPMNPYERRIIHAAVSEIQGVSSRSTGEEPYRKVIISSTVKRPERKPGFSNNRDNSRQQQPEPKRKTFDFKTSFEKDYKKPRPEDNLTSGLYSKIEF